MNCLSYQVLAIPCCWAVSSKEIFLTEPVLANFSGFLVTFLFHESGNAAKSLHVCPSHEIFDTLRTQDSVMLSVRNRTGNDKTMLRWWRPPRPPKKLIVSRRGLLEFSGRWRQSKTSYNIDAYAIQWSPVFLRFGHNHGRDLTELTMLRLVSLLGRHFL